MKTLFIGGIKSGKSLLAESYILKKSDVMRERPVYLATTEFVDAEMLQRIEIHKVRREKNFMTIEAPLDLYSSISSLHRPILIECTTMWINNMLYHQKSKEQIFEHMQQLLSLEKEMVFVHNDVGNGIIPDNALAREYVDISGMISQQIAEQCDEVYHCIAGIATQVKGK